MTWCSHLSSAFRNPVEVFEVEPVDEADDGPDVEISRTDVGDDC